ncbi:MAG: DUF86 domain-containing protein [Coriobacteriia bacterium]|nr:DUF86 domain-containing protein [Coriobacteriia bacterium]
MRTTSDYLDHVVAAADKIAEYVAGFDCDSFSADNKTQDAVIRQIEIIGEAGKYTLESCATFAADYPDIAREFQAAKGMRNVLAHGYFGVDVRIVWNTATKNIPELRDAIIGLM